MESEVAEQDRIIGYLGSGEAVVPSDRPSKRPPLARDLIIEALAQTRSSGASVIRHEIDFSPMLVGNDHCVVLGETAQVVFGRRDGYRDLAKWVLNQAGEPSTWLSLVLFQSRDTGARTFVLRAANAGRLQGLLPWDPRIGQSRNPSRQEALAYWKTRALVPRKEDDIMCHVCDGPANPPHPLYRGVVCSRCKDAIQTRHGNKPFCRIIDYPGWGLLRMPVL